MTYNSFERKWQLLLEPTLNYWSLCYLLHNRRQSIHMVEYLKYYSWYYWGKNRTKSNNLFVKVNIIKRIIIFFYLNLSIKRSVLEISAGFYWWIYTTGLYYVFKFAYTFSHSHASTHKYVKIHTWIYMHET